MRALLAGLVLLLLAGCGGEGETTATTATTGEPLVSYQRGGGIAGTYVEVVIAGDGSATVNEGYPEQGQKTREMTLSDAELAGVSEAAEAALPLEVGDTDTICADCFEYAIRVGDERIEFDSVDLDEGNVSPEVRELTSLLEELAGNP